MIRAYCLLFSLGILTLLALPVEADLLCGDCNADGVVDRNDSVLAAFLAATPAARTGGRLAACDVDNIGVVTILDAQQIGLPGGVRNCRLCGDCNNNGTPFEMADCAAIGSAVTGTTAFAVCDMDGDGTEGNPGDFAACMAGPPVGRCAVCGDCDLNGTVDIVDALRAAQIAAGLFSIPAASTCQAIACDADGNGTVTVLDANLIAQAAAGLMPVLGCP